MELIFVSLTIVSGFSFISYINYLERKKLALLIKGADLVEVKQYEKDEDTHTKLEDSIPEDIQEVFEGKTPDEINESFR